MHSCVCRALIYESHYRLGPVHAPPVSNLSLSLQKGSTAPNTNPAGNSCQVTSQRNNLVSACVGMYANVSLGQCALKRKCFKNRTPGYIHVQRFTSDPALYPFNTLPQSHPVMPHTYRVNSNHSTSPDVESVYRLQSTNIIQITFCRKCEKVPHESLKNPHVMFYEHKQKIGTGNIERLVFFN